MVDKYTVCRENQAQSHLAIVYRLETAEPGTKVNVPRGSLKGKWGKVPGLDLYISLKTGHMMHPSWLLSDLIVGDVLEIEWGKKGDNNGQSL